MLIKLMWSVISIRSSAGVLPARNAHLPVNLRRRKIGMAEQLLNFAQVFTLAHEILGEGVPQRMRRHVAPDASRPGGLFEDEPDALTRELLTAMVEEQHGGGTGARPPGGGGGAVLAP